MTAWGFPSLAEALKLAPLKPHCEVGLWIAFSCFMHASSFSALVETALTRGLESRWGILFVNILAGGLRRIVHGDIPTTSSPTGGLPDPSPAMSGLCVESV